jgi:alkylhydroperoxidase family enzyme
MSTYRIHTIESAPEKSKPALQDLKNTFGFVPNVAGAMAASPVLISAFVPVFHKVHSGCFTEAEIQVVLLTNAVTNAATWPVALHSKLALDAGVSADDVQAIRARRAPGDRKLAAMSALARAMIEKRGHLEDRDLAPLQEARPPSRRPRSSRSSWGDAARRRRATPGTAPDPVVAAPRAAAEAAREVGPGAAPRAAAGAARKVAQGAAPAAAEGRAAPGRAAAAAAPMRAAARRARRPEDPAAIRRGLRTTCVRPGPPASPGALRVT